MYIVKKTLVVLLLLLPCMAVGYNTYAQPAKRYNTDSLLNVLAEHKLIGRILQQAEQLYATAGIDPADVSRDAFRVAYLEKALIDKREIRIKHRHKYRQRNIITVVDFTRMSNARRFIVVDTRAGKVLYDTLVSQGAGRKPDKNDKYIIPDHFSNIKGSELSSLGMVLTTRSRQPENPCHFCRFAATIPHDCTIIMEGLEKRVNDNTKDRDIVIHTTGSRDLNNVKEQLGIEDADYRVAEEGCRCYHTNDSGTRVISTAAYASACGITENSGYIGQSNGCLVLPEENHIGVMQTLKKGALIFTYSNVITGGTNYFEQSPIIRQLIKFAAE